MLLTPPPVPADERIDVDPSVRAAAAGVDTWILLGDIDAALFQAGVIDVLLEACPPPALVFAGGVSTLNAILARAGSSLAFRVGWERLRAHHVLSAAALLRLPAIRLARNGDDLFESVRTLTAARSDADDHAMLRLLGRAGFVHAHAPLATGIVDESVRMRPGVPAFVTAIGEALAHGARRALVVGVDASSLRHHDMTHAIEAARARNLDVESLPAPTAPSPGLIGYLLPALGRADRVVHEGRASAHAWLASEQTRVNGARAIR